MADQPALGIIGAGNMGQAILRGALDNAVLAADRILVVDTDADRRAECERLGCRVSVDPADAADCEQIMLAVKPQVFPVVADSIGSLAREAIVISIMAGLSSHTIRRRLGEAARIVRTMPNTPCQIGQGMTAIALGAGAAEGDEALTVSLFSALGKTVIVDEAMMYAVTGVSGSGPAYLFLLAEAMQAAAERVGLSADTAELLVRQTLLGAASLLSESDRHASELRRAVTSPRGTTEAAIDVLLEKRFPLIVMEAIQAARDRGMELDEA